MRKVRDTGLSGLWRCVFTSQIFSVGSQDSFPLRSKERKFFSLLLRREEEETTSLSSIDKQIKSSFLYYSPVAQTLEFV